MSAIKDPNRILTTLFYLQRGKSTAASHRKNLARSSNQDQELAKINSLSADEYKLKLVPVLAYFVTLLVKRNDKISKEGKNVGFDVFNSLSPPEITIEAYLRRIIKYTTCSPECFLMAFSYIDQIIIKHNIMLDSLNVHRLILTSILIAAKLYDDTTYNNKYFSHVGGVPLKELNSMEYSFLVLMDFEMNLPIEKYDQYRYQAETQIIKWAEQSSSGYVSDQSKEEASHEAENHEVPPKKENIIVRDEVQLRPRGSSAKRFRRSRSFSSQSDIQVFKYRKRRSSSFNVLIAA